MRKFLGQNKRLVFTLIQKFRWDKGKDYPELSPRSDIIVMVDEAHRTTIQIVAENLRADLKNAQYLAFTGTPLLGRDLLTNQWFASYVSEYNFRQATNDGATVPLFSNINSRSTSTPSELPSRPHTLGTVTNVNSQMSSSVFVSSGLRGFAPLRLINLAPPRVT